MWWLAAALESTSPAWADDADPPPEVPERPLAIPASGRPPALPPVADGPPSVANAYDPRAVREYREHHLSVRTITETWYTTTWGPGWGYGWGWGPAWPQTWVHRDQRVLLFEGRRVIDVPTALSTLGDVPAQQQLLRRISNQRTASTALTSVGFVGMAATLVGLVGFDQARTLEEAETWSVVSGAGAGVMLVGLIGGAFPAARARTLLMDPSATFQPGEAERRFREHDDQLAAALGLSPAQVDAIEAEGLH
ncbi:MAG: hypothetical protein H6738_22055 [Alphaproteobacteria bacterium]|nr:hypothetical protein [Alphaproteobacteria bacterium]